MGLLSCNLGVASGPAVAFKVVQGQTIPFMFSGPMKGGSTATRVELVLRDNFFP